MTITEMIEKVEKLVDEVKYYGQIPTLETVEDLLVCLKEVESWLENQECDSCGDQFNEGISRAKLLVTEKVLRNTALKTRGEMIEAVEKLEME